MNKIISVFILGGLLLPGCEADPVIQSDNFRGRPVIYSLVNVNDTVHYIRVERFYSGNAAADVSGRNPDSLYFDNPAITVTMSGPAGDLNIKPEPVQIPDKSDGLFYSQEYTAYRFSLKLLNQYKQLLYSDYKITVEIPGLPVTTAVTDLQVPPVIWWPYIAQETHYITPDSPIRVQWSGGEWNEVDMAFEIMEQYPDTLKKQVVHVQRSNQEFITGHYYEVRISFELLVELIDKQLKPDRRLIRRYFGYAHTDIHTGNLDFELYMRWLRGYNDYSDLSYSNVVNGFGLVASRSTTSRDSMRLDYWSRMYLAAEPRLAKLGFIEY